MSGPAVQWIFAPSNARARHATLRSAEYRDAKHLNARPLCREARSVWLPWDGTRPLPICKRCHREIVRGDPEVFFPPEQLA